MPDVFDQVAVAQKGDIFDQIGAKQPAIRRAPAAADSDEDRETELNPPSELGITGAAGAALRKHIGATLTMTPDEIESRAFENRPLVTLPLATDKARLARLDAMMPAPNPFSEYDAVPPSQAAAIYNALAPDVTAMSTPKNLAILGATAGVGAEAKAGSLLARAALVPVLGTFAAQSAEEAGTRAGEAREIFDDPTKTPQEKTTALIRIGTPAAMALAAGLGTAATAGSLRPNVNLNGSRVGAAKREINVTGTGEEAPTPPARLALTAAPDPETASATEYAQWWNNRLTRDDNLRQSPRGLTLLQDQLRGAEQAQNVRVQDFLRARIDEVKLAIAARQAGAPEETAFGDNASKAQLALVETRPGKSANETARLQQQIAAETPEVNGGEIPANVQLPAQAHAILAQEGETAPAPTKQTRLKALADLNPQDFPSAGKKNAEAKAVNKVIVDQANALADIHGSENFPRAKLDEEGNIDFADRKQQIERTKWLKDAVDVPGATYKFTVMRMGGDYPDAIQVDVIGPKGENLASAMPEELRSLGVDLPEVPKDLPQGQYSVDQIRKAATQPTGDVFDRVASQTPNYPPAVNQIVARAKQLGLESTVTDLGSDSDSSTAGGQVAPTAPQSGGKASAETAPVVNEQGSGTGTIGQPKPKSKRIGLPADGHEDILNAIQDLGGIKHPDNVDNPGGEYDGFPGMMEAGGLPRSLVRRDGGGSTPDQLVGELADRGVSVRDADHMFSEIDKARTGRAAKRKDAKRDNYIARFENAFLGDAAKLERGGKSITVDDLRVGDTFSVNKEKFTVKKVDENGFVTVEDGVKRTLEPGTRVFPDKGKIKRGGKKVPDFVTLADEAAATPTDALEDVRKALHEFDHGDLTIGDLADRVEASDHGNAKLTAAVDRYRQEAEEDFQELAGRGDSDEYESALENAVREAVKPGAKEEPFSLASATNEQQAAEAAKARENVLAQQQRDKIQTLADKPLTGDSTNVGQGVLLKGDEDLFSGPSAESNAPLAQTGQPKPKAAGASKKSKAGGTLAEQFKKGSESGAIHVPDIPAIVKEVVAKLKKERDKMIAFAKSGPVREELAYTRDRADNQANILGREEGTAIRNALKRAFPGEYTLGARTAREVTAQRRVIPEEALSFAVEANGDPTAFRRWKAALTVAPNKSPWKARALEDIDFAEKNYSTLKPIAEQYEAATSRERATEVAGGIEVPYRKGYVMHAQDLDDPNSLPSMMSGGGAGNATGFRKMRIHDTFADSITAGVDPRSLNAVALLQSRVSAGQGLLNRRAWIDGLKNTVDPDSGLPVAIDAIPKTRPNGTTYYDVPPGYKLTTAVGAPIGIHNRYGWLFRSLTDQSAFNDMAFGRALQNVTGASKSAMLALDTFHLGRVAAWESVIKSPLAHPTTFRAPLPSYTRGVTLLDTSPDELRTMAANGEIPARLLPDMLRDKARLNLATESGANFGKISDGLHQDIIHSFPVLGGFNKWLFDKFQRGAMSEVWLLEFERQKAMFPKLSDLEVARKVSAEVNTRFGNLGRQGVLKSKTAQDLGRMVFLAPQWNEGLLRSEVGAVTQTLAGLKNAAQGRFQVGLLARAAGALALLYFAVNQVINYGTRGQPTWENKEEDFGAKISAWVPDKIGGGPGFFLNPMGLAGEITHLLEKRYEQNGGDVAKATESLVRSRASAFTRPLWTWWTGRDFLDRPVKKGEMLKTMAKETVPLPLAAPSAYAGAKQLLTGKHSETYTGQFQKQLMSSLGLKSDTAPYPEQRINRLAQQFNDTHGVERQTEFNGGDFTELNGALRLENSEMAKQSLAELLQKKTPAEVIAHYLRAFDFPYTGNAQREFQFYQTLNPEQRTSYMQGIADRMARAGRAIEFASPTDKNVFPVFDAAAAANKVKARIAVYDAYALPNGPQRQAAFDAISNDPALADNAEVVERTLGRTAPKTSAKVEALPIANGVRAKFIFNEWSKLPPSERQGYLDSLGAAVTDDVYDQLQQLKKAAATAGENNVQPPTPDKKTTSMNETDALETLTPKQAKKASAGTFRGTNGNIYTKSMSGAIRLVQSQKVGVVA